MEATSCIGLIAAACFGADPRSNFILSHSSKIIAICQREIVVLQLKRNSAPPIVVVAFLDQIVDEKLNVVLEAWLW